MSSISRQKIIIDTDCGMDDAIALVLALSRKKVAEIIAITCCFGKTSVDNVCSNVKRVLTLCDEKTIPIHRGSEGPMIKRESPLRAHGSDAFGERAHEFSTGGLKESAIPAAIALINFAKKYPKEITVIAIGPLTNLALAHRIDSSFTENLKSIVIMGGNHKGIGNVNDVAEFNFYSDPEAANIIVSEATCFVMVVPWETTLENGIEWGYYKELIKLNSRKGVFFKCITEFAANREQRKGMEMLMIGDVLAVLAALYPQSVKLSFKRYMMVECEGKLTRGMTILKSDASKDCNKKPACIIIHYDLKFLYSTLKQILA